MNIKTARTLKPGSKVKYPPDRGSPGGVGTVRSASVDRVHKNIRGEEYIWVGLKEGGVWPSNRLMW